MVRDRLGPDGCAHPDGARKIIELLESEIFVRRKELASDLASIGVRPDGIMSRSYGEPMSQYIIRREKWYKRLVDLGQGGWKYEPPQLAEYLIKAARLNDEQVLHVRSKVEDVTDTNVLDETKKVMPRIFASIHDKRGSQGERVLFRELHSSRASLPRCGLEAPVVVPTITYKAFFLPSRR